MMKETLSQTNIIEGPLFALILFVLVFLLVTVRVLMRGKHDPKAMHLASLPLFDDARPVLSPEPMPEPTPEPTEVAR
ncbi:MAG TPA: hypothetical protein PK095_08495 [Myxococcota bacterium]|nr:hypothetical protein [Myxococcota bacterium]